MADLVKELRECADIQSHEEWAFTRPKLLAAADEIERLRAALRPFADRVRKDGSIVSGRIPDEDFRKARAALAYEQSAVNGQGPADSH